MNIQLLQLCSVALMIAPIAALMMGGLIIAAFTIIWG
jgi:hypothetical protein